MSSGYISPVAEFNPPPQSWVVISLNLAVHVIMCKITSQLSTPCAYWITKTITTLLLPVEPRYGYACALYCLRNVPLRRFPTQWKKYLTSMQIIQFIIDIFIVYFGSKFRIIYSQI